MALREEITHSGNRSNLRNVVYSQKLRHYKAYDRTHLKALGLVGEEKTEDLRKSGDGEDEAYPIIAKKDFETHAGDEMIDQMFEPLDASSTSGFAGSYLIHGGTAEKNLTFRRIRMFIYTLKNAAGWDGDMSQQRVGFSLEGLTKDALENWSARRWETDCYYTWYNGYSPHIALNTEISTGLNKGTIANAAPNLVFAGVATSAINVGEGDELNVDLLDRLGSHCVYNRIQPVIIKGYDPLWVLLVHTFQYKSLRRDPMWQKCKTDGMPRGEKNHQIFTRAKGMWGGILVVEVPGQDFISTPANAAAGGENYAHKRRALLLGGGSLYYGQVKKSRRIAPLKEDDFGDHSAWCIRNIEGMRRGEWEPDPTDATYHNQSLVEVVTYAANTF